MLRCIAIDDEELALELLADNISKVPFLQLLETFDNPLNALAYLQNEPVDLVFLDIQMPGLTGLQFIESLPKKCLFIFITAYERYALESYNLNVVDYLVKPVALDRFIRACNKAWELYRLRNKPQAATAQASDYFFVNADYSFLKIAFADIVWIEGLKDYLKIYLHHTAKPVITRMSMKAMEEQLPASLFLRVHKSYIISKNYLTMVRRNSVFLGEMEIPVGDSFKEAVTAFINRHLEP